VNEPDTASVPVPSHEPPAAPLPRLCSEEPSTAPHPTLVEFPDEPPVIIARDTPRPLPPLATILAIGTARDRSAFHARATEGHAPRLAWRWMPPEDAVPYAWWIRAGDFDALAIGSEAGTRAITLPPDAAAASAWRVAGRQARGTWIFAPANTEGALDAVIGSIPYLGRRRHARLRGTPLRTRAAILPFDTEAMRAFARQVIGLLIERGGEVVLVPPAAPATDLGRAWLEAMLPALTTVGGGAMAHSQFRAVAPDTAMLMMTSPHPPENIVAAALVAPLLAAAAGTAIPASLGARCPILRIPHYPDGRDGAWPEAADLAMALLAR
jgi:hypothetical protein